ncbi:hypothetical protein LINPERHAP2_LOCUS1794, partial [Linum perenne]
AALLFLNCCCTTLLKLLLQISSWAAKHITSAGDFLFSRTSYSSTGFS